MTNNNGGEVAEVIKRAEAVAMKNYLTDKTQYGTRVQDLNTGIAFTRRPGGEVNPYPRFTRLWVSNGWRRAVIAGVDDPNGRILFRYFMPDGRSFLQEWERFVYSFGDKSYRKIRTVNAKRPPKVWRSVLEEAQ